MKERYALCYAPEQGSPLATFGARWLGRDAATGVRCMQTCVPGLSEDEMYEWTVKPRRTGFCAVLKPPFALAPERTEDELLHALAGFAAERAPLTLPPLAVQHRAGALLLAPESIPRDLETFAAECVTLFDGFRDPETGNAAHDDGLTPRQQTLAARLGHPHVLDEFLFHLPLCGLLPAGRKADALHRAAEALTLSIRRKPLRIREVCVFRRPQDAERFTILKRFPLAGSADATRPSQARAV